MKGRKLLRKISAPVFYSGELLFCGSIGAFLALRNELVIPSPYFLAAVATGLAICFVGMWLQSRSLGGKWIL